MQLNQVAGEFVYLFILRAVASLDKNWLIAAIGHEQSVTAIDLKVCSSAIAVGGYLCQLGLLCGAYQPLIRM